MPNSEHTAAIGTNQVIQSQNSINKSEGGEDIENISKEYQHRKNEPIQETHNNIESIGSVTNTSEIQKMNITPKKLVRLYN